MSKPSLVIVLAEDQRQKRLMYLFLKSAGVRPRQIRFHLSPSGRGSAEHWVRENFAEQVRVCRTRHAQTGMFVVLDADTMTVQERLDTLDRALLSVGQNPIDPNQDKIARLIPKRNVETWILFLTLKGEADPPIDETTDYKRTRTGEEWSALIPAAVETLCAWTRPSAALPTNLIAGLRLSVGEISRALSA